ncbi:hypothetical protein PV08_00108 [Exophiala spinifera]|uniref:Transcription factor domain-containing protein n=1 Tax=Exophiala spinifera TaxID=91928 RepID=A0A0D1YWA5_9EURO|nr:uncharacterized protein PV08_00108 [Exophiala spinifera]KIW19536.1 hypothetical protein PV08_00108 [Exophiala spinifera]
MEWSPQEAGLPPLPALKGNSSGNNVISGIFVSENRRIESRYEILDPDPKSPSDVSGGEFQLSHGGSVRNGPTVQHHPTESAGSPGPLYHHPPITDPTEAFFMERYCNILGPWFDMFDTIRHWSHAVPHLSLSNPSLFRSIIASCSKQYSLVSGESSIYALDQYNRGLKELTRALGEGEGNGSESTTGHAAVFASCLLIGYCEMIDAQSLDWHTHLSGTFSLCSSQGWHGRSGGVAQSCFWVYCRMDLLAAIARARHTLLDPSRWLPDGTSLAPPRQRAHDWDLDSWCNHVVVLLAQTHNLLCDVRQPLRTSTEQSELEERWNGMSTSLDTHESSRPIALRPIIDLPPKDPRMPFRQIIYVSAAACAATQMMDLACLFLILAFPDRTPAERAVRLMSESVCREAVGLSRKIVSNSIANRHPIAWANAVQLLSSAGTILVGRPEREALLRVLNDIKLETGWNTLGNCQSLRAWWDSFWPGADDGLHTTDDDDVKTLLRVGKSLIRLST